MPLYTGRVTDGLLHKEKGLRRILTLSRLSDTTGLHPDERLWKGIKTEQGYESLFDNWIPSLAPPQELVAHWYHVGEYKKQPLPWEQCKEEYLTHLNKKEQQPFLNELARDAFRLDAGQRNTGIMLHCCCPHPKTQLHEDLCCHRVILAEKLAEIVRRVYKHEISIYHFHDAQTI
ncbi:MAG TPA: hypothetical protein VJK51_01670 [Candidatus Nanoarchaeia archaeon]|nr:hypothetical protein [Candidatus Nanoarchaeia archaeon]